VARLSTRLEVVTQAAPLLVPLVEEGWLEGTVPELAVERYVAPLIASGAGVLVLGCTHYPLLKDTVARVAARLAGREIPVVDSALATAEAVEALLREERVRPAPVQARPQGAGLELLVTDLPASFGAMARRFLGGDVSPEVTQIDIQSAP
jgi:glutamate racemase